MKTESVEYVCDIAGKKCEPMSESEHSATLTFDFGYGSKFDGSHAEIHLGAAAAEEVWTLLCERYPQLRLADGRCSRALPPLPSPLCSRHGEASHQP